MQKCHKNICSFRCEIQNMFLMTERELLEVKPNNM